MRQQTRRIVTGHLADGRSVVLQDGPVPHVRNLPGARFDEVWSTATVPDALSLAPANEPTSDAPLIGPPEGGTTIRIIDFAPTGEGGERSPMHRTRSIDYGIVLEGEIILILSDSEVVLRQGDVVIQRATDHAWQNRSAHWARMAFILIGATFDANLEEKFSGQDFMD